MAFPTNYHYEILHEMPQPLTIKHYYFPGAVTTGGKDGLLLLIKPDGAEPWIGTFADGSHGAKFQNGVYTTPDPDRLCVVSYGKGYIVSARDPQKIETVNLIPILDVRPVTRKGLLIFADYIQLLAYDKTGICWRTKRIAWDDLSINEITDDQIHGEYRDYRSEKSEKFTVDLTTGEVSGGAGFP